MQEPSSDTKRVRASNATAMLKLADTVSTLIADIARPAASSPSTPSRRGSSLAPALDASPVRRDRAFRRVLERAMLTPRRLARARVIFRGKTELADEYLSFGDDEVEQEAQKVWLEDELELVLRARACRQSEY
jgi:hypothetical protein